jgi:hypothetical protein
MQTILKLLLIFLFFKATKSSAAELAEKKCSMFNVQSLTTKIRFPAKAPHSTALSAGKAQRFLNFRHRLILKNTVLKLQVECFVGRKCNDHIFKSLKFYISELTLNFAGLEYSLSGSTTLTTGKL